MKCSQNLIIAWASLRVTYLDRLTRYEDSYAVSQEFCEWTTSMNVYPEDLEAQILQVPIFNKENRTGFLTQLLSYLGKILNTFCRLSNPLTLFKRLLKAPY